MESGFRCIAANSGIRVDLTAGQEQFCVQSWHDSQMDLSAGATHFGFCKDGARIECSRGSFALGPGMYFCLPGEGHLSSRGQGLLISQANRHGLFMVGGPIESKGRLRYIDGCSDTLLVPPVMLGDACLNLLHIPPGTSQTPHTHPSFRVGMVVSGSGECRTPDGVFALEPGLVFVIAADSLHSFHTKQAALTIVAFHPDSDFGPTHEDHPMLNRTLVDGRKAEVVNLKPPSVAPIS